MRDRPSEERLGRYRLLRRLGRGGMATVYHAVQEGPLDFENEVAIKLVHPELVEDHPQLLRGLVDEARIAARIRHPNVVRILDLVQEGDLFYMVMDYVDGVSMRRVLDVARETGRRTSIGPVLEVLAAAARGVDAAHQLTLPDGSPGGLVHRDMKPGNILVSHDGHVKVSDFGIAMFGDRLSESTQAGQMKGTPAYMSPEQILGEPLSARSDIFSLGLTLYTMLTSRLVFQADTAMAVALAIAHKSMDSQAAELDAMLPGLGHVFATATRRNPDERFLDGTTLADALTELHRTIQGPGSIAEMVLATGWLPHSKGGAVVEDDDDPTDPGLTAPDEEATVADAKTPVGGPAQLATEEPSQRIVVQPSSGFLPDLDYEEEPTIAEVVIPIGDTTDHGPAPIADLRADDPESTPVTAHGPPPLVDPLPGPMGAPIIDVAPVAAQSRPIPPLPHIPPLVSPETTLPHAEVQRPRVQPERDFRGRVVRGNKLTQNTSVSRGEKIGVAVAFTLLLVAVVTIVLLQVLKPVPPDRDPRVVGAEALPEPPPKPVAARPAAGPAQDAAVAIEAVPAEPTAMPAPPPSASAPSLEDRLRAARGEAPLPKAAAETKPRPVEKPPAKAPERTASREPAAKPAAKPAARPAAKPAAKPAARPAAKPAAKPEPEPEPPPPAAEPGTLVVNSYPWSNVFIDGKPAGRTPVRGMELPAGKHTVKLVFPSAGDQEFTQTVTVEAGGKASVIKKLDTP